MRQDDIAAGLRLCRAASWNQVASDWSLFLSAPDACRVAVTDNGEIVGSVATIDYGSFSWIAMVLVDPACRRTGIGSQLLKDALVILGDRTARLDATPAGCHVYVPLGFQEEYGLQRMTREAARSIAAPDFDTMSAARRMTEADFIDVLNQDPAIFGGDRRSVLHMLRTEAPEYAYVAASNRIDGYVFGRHGHSFEHIGPVVARDESIARGLVSACLGGRSDRPFVLDTPVRSSWVGWLEAIGFRLQRPFTRMCRGSHRFEERAEEIFAITGPEFG